MPRYMFQAAYTPAAMAAFISKPQDRVPGIKAVIEKMGGKMVSVDFCMGDYDVVLMAELPDDVAAAALALAVSAPGHLKSYRTTKLISPADFLAAQKKAQGAGYKAPAADK